MNEEKIQEVPSMSQFANKADYLAALASQSPVQEPVAYGLPNTMITGQRHALMQVELDIPSDDQYGGKFWVPLYTMPQPDRVAELEAEIEALKAQVIAPDVRADILNLLTTLLPKVNYKADSTVVKVLAAVKP